MLYQLSYASTLEGSFDAPRTSTAEASWIFRVAGRYRARVPNQLYENITAGRQLWNSKARCCDDLADEINFGLHRNNAAFVAERQELLDGLFAIGTVIKSALVDVHADKTIR